jgi:hypothetical protein
MASLRPDAKTCSPACSRNRERRGPRRVTGPPQGWSCAYCGCDFAEANRKRLDAGCRPLFSQVQRYCTPRCAKDAWGFRKTIRHREKHPDAPYRGRSR